jgi:hypothetical protein
MTRHLRERKTDRRGFLKGLAAAGGLVAAAGAAKATTEQVAEGASVEASPRPGYRVTPHVSKYYQKARF